MATVNICVLFVDFGLNFYKPLLQKILCSKQDVFIKIEGGIKEQQRGLQRTSVIAIS